MESQLFLVYKPWGMVSQFITNDVKQSKKRFLGELGIFPKGAMAVGRLDEDSEGLLLITTNGTWSNTINNSAKWEKEYVVQVDGQITPGVIAQLEHSVVISVQGKPYNTKPCKVTILTETPVLPPTKQRIRDDRHGPTSWISMTLNEGKFRQIRKMTAAVGYPTLRLARIRIGIFKLKNLNEHCCVEVTSLFKEHFTP